LNAAVNALPGLDMSKICGICLLVLCKCCVLRWSSGWRSPVGIGCAQISLIFLKGCVQSCAVCICCNLILIGGRWLLVLLGVMPSTAALAMVCCWLPDQVLMNALVRWCVRDMCVCETTCVCVCVCVCLAVCMCGCLLHQSGKALAFVPAAPHRHLIFLPSSQRVGSQW
jgi:hypothetical protein